MTCGQGRCLKIEKGAFWGIFGHFESNTVLEPHVRWSWSIAHLEDKDLEKIMTKYESHRIKIVVCRDNNVFPYKNAGAGPLYIAFWGVKHNM